MRAAAFPAHLSLGFTRQEEQGYPGPSGIPSRCHLPSLSTKEEEEKLVPPWGPNLAQRTQGRSWISARSRMLFRQRVPPHTALYETTPGFITPAMEVTLGLRSPFKSLTLFDFLLSVSRAKIDLMHHNPLVCSTFPAPCWSCLTYFF